MTMLTFLAIPSKEWSSQIVILFTFWRSLYWLEWKFGVTKQWACCNILTKRFSPKPPFFVEPKMFCRKFWFQLKLAQVQDGICGPDPKERDPSTTDFLPDSEQNLECEFLAYHLCYWLFWGVWLSESFERSHFHSKSHLFLQLFSIISTLSRLILTQLGFILGSSTEWHRKIKETGPSRFKERERELRFVSVIPKLQTSQSPPATSYVKLESDKK